jgi:predicted site-specific integrase-resolvase
MAEKMWTPKELSLEWQVTTAAIYKWIKEGKLAATRQGVTQRIVIADSAKRTFEAQRRADASGQETSEENSLALPLAA